MTETLLEVRDLTVRFSPSSAPVLRRISFEVKTGEAVGVLGQSGAGKTTLARTLLRLLPAGCRVVEGSVRFRNRDLLEMSSRELDRIRGAQISMIPQEPELSLNPVLRVRTQVDEVLRAHTKWTRKRRASEVESMFTKAGLPDADLYSSYPHQLSGGQRQRVIIAQALIAKPSLLIADEPTSALDTVVQAEILELLQQLNRELGVAMLFITHNPALLSGFADRVIVMEAGELIETGTFDEMRTRSFAAMPQLRGAAPGSAEISREA